MDKQARGIKNNNPLNIRYSESNNWVGRRVGEKQDMEFEEFELLKWGFRAAFILIHNYMTLKKATTIESIITRWAPPTDFNDTYNYIRIVSEYVGKRPTEDIFFDDGVIMTGIVTAMAKMEVGVSYPLSEVMRGYVLACLSLGITPKWYGFEMHRNMYRVIEKEEIKEAL